jgi:hypothetical protein
MNGNRNSACGNASARRPGADMAAIHAPFPLPAPGQRQPNSFSAPASRSAKPPRSLTIRASRRNSSRRHRKNRRSPSPDGSNAGARLNGGRMEVTSHALATSQSLSFDPAIGPPSPVRPAPWRRDHRPSVKGGSPMAHEAGGRSGAHHEGPDRRNLGRSVREARRAAAAAPLTPPAAIGRRTECAQTVRCSQTAHKSRAD